jgi:hypothetical protein
MPGDRRLETMLARGLGLFSLGLGAVQLVAPATFNRVLGVGKKRTTTAGRLPRLVTRMIGIRELIAAMGLLTRRRPAAFSWSRVTGDAMDLALLARASTRPDARRPRLAAAMAGVAALSLVDLVTSSLLSEATSAPREERVGNARRFRRAITVRRPMDETIATWRSRWPGIEAPAGEDGRYSFESSDGVLGPLRGTVVFNAAPGDRGTEIRLEAEYEPPLGPIGIGLSRLSPEEPARRADDQLRRLKEVAETGQEVESDATTAGHRIRQQSAQPHGGQ